MTKEQLFLVKLIKVVLNEEKATISSDCHDLNKKKLLQLIKKYGLSYFAVTAASELREVFNTEENEQLHISAMSFVAQSMRYDFSWQEIRDAFEKAGIDYLPMKGIVTKNYYPMPELRMMCDIDILYKEEHHKAMLDVMRGLGYESHVEGIKHDHFMDRHGQHIEMHREMVEAGTEYRKYYEGIWKRAKKVEGYRHQFYLSPEDEYIFTIVHLKEHFIHGEAVFKMVMDVYVMNQKLHFSQDYLDAEFQKIGLMEFEENIRKLAYRWFDSDRVQMDADDMLYELSEYFLGNINFGSKPEHTASLAYQIGGSKWRYFLHAVFPDSHRMKSLYPWLRKAPMLLPAAWIIRICRALKYRETNINNELSILKSIDKNSFAQGERMAKLFVKYGIKI